VYAYPKVTMKTISSMLIGCYSAKDWIEGQKRKQLVKRVAQSEAKAPTIQYKQRVLTLQLVDIQAELQCH
jgi:hypothetical protein